MLNFERDTDKSLENSKKHGITVHEAKSVFADTNGKLIDDPDHSDEEERYILLGLSANLRLLTVCHCYREQDSTIRIISARKATNPEAKNY